MNEHLSERFGHSRDAFRQRRGPEFMTPPAPCLNEKIRQYFDAPATPAQGGAWLEVPELPTSAEVLGLDDRGVARNTISELPYNLPEGKWQSKETYLRTHYELLREGAIGPLREVVKQVRQNPEYNEDQFERIAAGIYEKVRICGLTCSQRGVAIRITFSVYRSQKKILWEQSKRLITGSLVVLTPRTDMFKSRAIVATVAARPLAGLQQNPPEIDLLIARAEEMEIDPAAEFVMVEDRNGLYEADRHTLLALQKMMSEPFPLMEHIVDADPSVATSKNLHQRRQFDVSCIIPDAQHQSYHNVDVLNAWPEHVECTLDNTQLAALRRMLTKRLAVVQGPPGTGKTFVSVQAIKTLLANRRESDPPIIIACQTNHAIDQILDHIAEFEDVGFLRLGGRCKGTPRVIRRTLFEVRRSESNNPVSGSVGRRARKAMAIIDQKMEVLLSPLQTNKQPLDLDTLVCLGILTEEQRTSLVIGAAEWIRVQPNGDDLAQSPFFVWLGKKLVSVAYKPEERDYGFDFEEAEMEIEQLRELEAENSAKDDEDFDTLKGTTFCIADNYTTKTPKIQSRAEVKEALREQDLFKIKPASRPSIYSYLQQEMKARILADVRCLTKEYNHEAWRRRVGGWEQDEPLLKRQKILGMTTTGLSKYRGLLSSLCPTIILIEEAGETLEAPITAACLPSLQQLILVGDHQQLRPHCHSKFLEGDPFYFNISLFERLVNNGIEYTQLATQRRMTPEIRRLLYPMYGTSIHDHESVLDPQRRLDVPGMGKMNSFFFTHKWLEQRDDKMSAFNPMEADMVVNFVEYLGYNGVRFSSITILTFYHGQRKTIVRRLQDKATLRKEFPRVVTVDSYQGEENEIVILSLVRSNEYGQVGFLNNINRVCVAMSRAKSGFYMFGNGTLLFNYKDLADAEKKEEKTFWQQIMAILGNTGDNAADRLSCAPRVRVGQRLMVTCAKHGNRTAIEDPNDFNKIVGGCAVMLCGEKLICGHACKFPCHPFSHAEVKCHEACENELACGHPCDKRCYHRHVSPYEPCHCMRCRKDHRDNSAGEMREERREESSSPRKKAGIETWKRYAETEQTGCLGRISGRENPENTNTLVDINGRSDLEGTMQVVGLQSSGDATKSKSSQSGFPYDGPKASKGKRGTRKVKSRSGTLCDKEVPLPAMKDWSKEASLLD